MMLRLFRATAKPRIQLCRLFSDLAPTLSKTQKALSYVNLYDDKPYLHKDIHKEFDVPFNEKLLSAYSSSPIIKAMIDGFEAAYPKEILVFQSNSIKDDKQHDEIAHFNVDPNRYSKSSLHDKPYIWMASFHSIESEINEEPIFGGSLPAARLSIFIHELTHFLDYAIQKQLDEKKLIDFLHQQLDGALASDISDLKQKKLNDYLSRLVNEVLQKIKKYSEDQHLLEWKAYFAQMATLMTDKDMQEVMPETYRWFTQVFIKCVNVYTSHLIEQQTAGIEKESVDKPSHYRYRSS